MKESCCDFKSPDMIWKSPDEVEKEHQSILRNKVCLVQVNWWILSTVSRLSSQTSPTTCACPCPTLTVQHCSMWPMDWPRPVKYQVGIWIIFICNGNIAEATSNIELILFPVPVSSLAPMIPVPVLTPACNINTDSKGARRQQHPHEATRLLLRCSMVAASVALWREEDPQLFLGTRRIKTVQFSHF